MGMRKLDSMKIAGLVAAIAGTIGLTACGSDDTDFQFDAGSGGASADGAADGAANKGGSDGGRDAATGAGGAGGSATGSGGGGGSGGQAGSAGGAGHAGTATDSGAGGSTSDAGTGGKDAGPGGADAGTGGADAGAGDADAGTADADDGEASSDDGGTSPDVDAGPLYSLGSYLHDIDTAFCEIFNSCCGESVDGGFPVSDCAAHWDANYGVINLGTYLHGLYVDGSGYASFEGVHMTLSQGQMAECLSKIRAIPGCELTASVQKDIYQTCITAVQGALLSGQTGCRSTAECAEGYCDLPAADSDAGVLGTCHDLIAENQPCTDPNFNADECAYEGLRSSSNPIFCTGVNADDGTGVCSTSGLGASGDSCQEAQQCESGSFCGFNGYCQASSSINEALCTLSLN